MTTPAISRVYQKDIEELLALARAGDLDAAGQQQLAHLIEADQRIATAIGLRRRGGEPDWRAKSRAERDNALRELARQIGSDLLIEQQCREIVRLVRRYVAAAHRTEGGGSAAQQLLQRINTIGLPVPKKRQLRQILDPKPRKT